jgi:catechol 2,3-dioxygenase-like lactoylglutathione lyase family enzyme
VAEQPRFLAAIPALPVSDERRAVDFLTGALGFVELQHEGRGIGFLRRDGVQIQLWVPDGSAPGAERYLAGSASCQLEVTGIAELYRHCQAVGVVHPNAPLTDQPWGMREFAILDPDNNLITLYERTTRS